MGSLNRSVVAPLSSAIITVMLAGLVVAGVDSLNQNNVKPGTARLEPTGVVEVSIGAGPFVRVSHGRTLRANDAVRVLDGRAVLELSDASKLEMRDGSALTVRGAASPAVALDEGDLLVEADQGDTVDIDGGTALISVAGSAKLRRGVSLAAGVYEGTARFQRNDQGLTIPQYRQAAVVGTGILPQSPEPLGLAPGDEWDRRMLGSVMALDEQLGIIARTFEVAAPPFPGADFFKGVAPKVASLPITPELLDGRSAGENLIGLTLVSLDKGDFLHRFQRVFGFRAQGASWGLVAADRSINPTPVIDDLELALANLAPDAPPGEQAAPGDGSNRGRSVNLGRLGPIIPGTGGSGTGGSSADGTGDTGGSGGTDGTGGSGGSGGTGGGTNPGGGGNPGGGNPGGGSTPPRKLIDLPQTGTFLDPLLDPLITPVEDLLSGLLGGLLGQGTPSTSATGTTSPLSPVSSPTGSTTATLPASSPTSGTTGTGTTGSGSTGATATGTGATTTGSASTSTPSSSPTSTTTTTRPGLLGGLVGGLTKTLGGLL